MPDIVTRHSRQTNGVMLVAGFGLLTGAGVAAHTFGDNGADFANVPFEPESVYRADFPRLTSSSTTVVAAATPDSLLDAAVQHVYSEIAKNQQPLGREFEQVLFANLSDLYIED